MARELISARKRYRTGSRHALAAAGALSGGGTGGCGHAAEEPGALGFSFRDTWQAQLEALKSEFIPAFVAQMGLKMSQQRLQQAADGVEKVVVQAKEELGGKSQSTVTSKLSLELRAPLNSFKIL